MIEEKTFVKARTALLRLLSYRSRSRQEAAEYLRRKGFDDGIVDSVIEEMERWGYIDDHRYAVDYTESCLRRGLGPLRVRHNLLSRGISRELAEQEIARCYSPEEEQALARELLGKRNASGDDLNDKRWIRRQAAYLQRRGFREGVVVRVIREYCLRSDE